MRPSLFFPVENNLKRKWMQAVRIELAAPALLTHLPFFPQCKVIICQMSSTQPELLHWFLFPLALVVYAAISGLLGRAEEAVLGAFTALVTAAHVHYGICVVRGWGELCTLWG